MWRFVLVMFAGLGWAFFELSGGTDYTPRVGSLQARAGDEATRPVPRPQTIEVSALAPALAPAETREAAERGAAPVTRSIASMAEIALAGSERPGTATTVERAVTDTAPGIADAASEPGGAGLALLDPDFGTSPAPATETATAGGSEPAAGLADMVAQDVARAAAPPRDIRRVAGSVVNLRAGPGTEFDRVGRLTEGTRIEVLSETAAGWVEARVLDSGETGWMADWLVTAAN